MEEHPEEEMVRVGLEKDSYEDRSRREQVCLGQGTACYVTYLFLKPRMMPWWFWPLAFLKLPSVLLLN